MDNSDTLKLLRECSMGIKMAIGTIEEIEKDACNNVMKKLLNESKKLHKELENRIYSQLKKFGAMEKEPSSMAKSMSWLKTNMKMGMDNSDATIADLITDGCNMGIKYLNKYLNQYKNADNLSQQVCTELIDTEENLRKNISSFL